jgi:hypothetical protein
MKSKQDEEFIIHLEDDLFLSWLVLFSALKWSTPFSSFFFHDEENHQIMNLHSERAAKYNTTVTQITSFIFKS